MAEKLKFELVSPERLLMEADVDMVTIPGTEGDFGVLPGHAPVISTLRPNILEVTETEGESPRRIFVRGGFADVALDRVTVLAEEAIDLRELDRADLEQKIKDASEDVEDATSDEAREQAQEVHDQLKELLDALE